MQLCMFHPEEHPMERGWVGRIDGDRVVHLAAQTLQSFLTGGGSAREHAEYRLDAVCLLAPVLHPPTVRIFEDQRSFVFANSAAVVAPRAEIAPPGGPCDGQVRACLLLAPRIAAVIGGGGAIAGFTSFGEWRDPRGRPPKDRDFALSLGPVVVTPDVLDPEGLAGAVRVGASERLGGRFTGFDWAVARDLAEAGTVLRAGDLLAGPALATVEVEAGSEVELEVDRIGVLAASVRGA